MDPYLQFYEIIESFKQQPELLRLLPAKLGTINLITNVPIDDPLIHTPRTDVTPPEKSHVSELSLLLMSSVLHSCPYINEDEKSGTVIQNVIPIPGKEREISGSGSLLQFNWHTENVHEEHPAEYLMLLCLRGDKNAYTSFMLIEDILGGLDDDFLEQLKTTQFLMKTGPSYHKEKVFVRSILSVEKNGQYSIVYNSDIARCCPQDEFGKKVYTDFKAYIESAVPSYAISLEPGECVIMKNREAMHKRDGFVISTADEERRWLQRVYLKNPNYLHNNGRPAK
jgi:L-asparagine oxygenase